MPERSPVHQLWCWRHPRAQGQAGHCIGRSDLPVDPRKAKRLAHRIRACVRQHGLPRHIHTSPLRRTRDVARWLRRWGFQVTVDARLAEMDFGAWDGRPWAGIDRAEVQAWEADFLHHRPGGGESLAQLLARVQNWLQEGDGQPRLAVTHGGWLNAWRHLAAGGPAPQAARWPPAPPHGSLVQG
jgi:alpha-ribazole phosphatase